MKYLLIVLLWISFLFGNNCVQKFDFKEDPNFYIISVFDYVSTSEEEDLSLEAKMYLFISLKNIYKKRIYGLKLKDFQEIDNYMCKNVLHCVYRVRKKDITIIYKKNDGKDIITYRDLRKKILYRISLLEIKEKLTLEDYKKLYSLYFSLGKINDANRAMDKIIELKWSGK